MGEFRLHHVKFFEYQPSCIKCLAHDKTSTRLAVGREDGSVEIWSPQDNWYQEKVIPGSKKRRIDALVWAQGRLFSTGLQGNIVEYDLQKHAVKKSTYYGDGFWCMASNHAESLLATGSEDGCVRLYEISDEGVMFERPLDSQEGRIVSLAWHHDDEIIVTGSVDNIRVWNVTTGHAIQRISVQRTAVSKTIVWSVAVLKDLTIISGDSSGRTQFWNGKMGTLLRSFTSHRADVQSVCVNEEGTAAFSSGVHPIIAKFELADSDRTGSKKVWAPSNNKVGGSDYSHDVKALAIAGDFLVSGGVDTNLVVNSVALFDGKQRKSRYKQKILSFPHKSMICLATKVKVLLLQYPTYLELWKLGSPKHISGTDGDHLPLAEEPVKILQLKIKGSEHIVCSTISRCGSWLAYSDVDRVRLYNITLSPPSINKVAILPASLKPAHHMTFTKDNHLVLASHDASVQVLTMDSVQPSMLQTFPSLPASISEMTVSDDGKSVAVSDLSGDIHVYSLDKRKVMGKLPRYKHRVAALTFDSDGDLVVAYSDRMLHHYDVKRLSFTIWGTKLHRHGLHHAWMSRREPIVQLLSNPTSSNRFIVQDQQSFVIVDRSKPLPRADQKLYEPLGGQTSPPTKRKNPTKKDQHGFSICRKYRPLLYAGFLDEPGWLVVVERSTQAVMDSLPPTLQQKKFGT